VHIWTLGLLLENEGVMTQNPHKIAATGHWRTVSTYGRPGWEWETTLHTWPL